MHIEKNVCDNILNTLLQKDGKSKDNIKACLDLQAMNIREPLHSKTLDNGKVLLPPALSNMTNEEKERFLMVLKNLKLPHGFSSNFSQLVQVHEHKIVEMKNHDSHILMQQVLPFAMRTSLSKHVGLVLNEYCMFFRELCSKVIDVKTIEKLEVSIPTILCKLEKIFPKTSLM